MAGKRDPPQGPKPYSVAFAQSICVREEGSCWGPSQQMLVVLGFLLLIWEGFRPRGESLFPSPVSHDFLYLSLLSACSYGRKILVLVKPSNSIRYKKLHHLRDPQTGSCLILYLHFYKHLDMHS